MAENPGDHTEQKQCDGTGRIIERVEHGDNLRPCPGCDHADCPNPKPEGETCKRCGSENAVWGASSPLWNAVMRGGSINGDPIWNDMVCATCFMQLAEEKGVASHFHVTADRVNVELETVTPSGRVWDEKARLWVEPSADQPSVEVSEEAVRQLLGQMAKDLYAAWYDDPDTAWDDLPVEHVEAWKEPFRKVLPALLQAAPQPAPEAEYRVNAHTGIYGPYHERVALQVFAEQPSNSEKRQPVIEVRSVGAWQEAPTKLCARCGGDGTEPCDGVDVRCGDCEGSGVQIIWSGYYCQPLSHTPSVEVGEEAVEAARVALRDELKLPEHLRPIPAELARKALQAAAPAIAAKAVEEVEGRAINAEAYLSHERRLNAGMRALLAECPVCHGCGEGREIDDVQAVPACDRCKGLGVVAPERDQTAKAVEAERARLEKHTASEREGWARKLLKAERAVDRGRESEHVAVRLDRELREAKVQAAKAVEEKDAEIERLRESRDLHERVAKTEERRRHEAEAERDSISESYDRMKVARTEALRERDQAIQKERERLRKVAEELLKVAEELLSEAARIEADFINRARFETLRNAASRFRTALDQEVPGA